MLELRFTLPSDLLSVYPEETIALQLGHEIPRTAGREVYAIAFVDANANVREEIAR
jgi:hypothetical protein